MRTLIACALALFAGLACLCLVPPVRGECRVVHRAVVSAPTYHAPVVVKKDVAVIKEVPVFTRFIAVIPLVDLPSYSAVYAPPVVVSPAAPPAIAPVPAGQAAAAPGADMKAVLDLLKAMDARIQKLEAGPKKPADPFAPAAAAPAQPAAQQARPDVLKVIVAKCASCHDAKAAADKGGGLTLTDAGALVRLTDRQARKTLTSVYAGKMPPRSSGIAPLSDEEVAVVVAHLDK